MIYVSVPFFLALMFMATVGPPTCIVLGAMFGRSAALSGHDDE